MENVTERPRKLIYTGPWHPEDWCEFCCDLHLPCGVYTLNDFEQQSESSEFDLNIIFIDCWVKEIYFSSPERAPDERKALANAMRTLSSAFPTAQLLLAIVPDRDCDKEAKESYTKNRGSLAHPLFNLTSIRNI